LESFQYSVNDVKLKKRYSFIVEFVGTFILTLSVIKTVLDKKSTPESYGIVYGALTTVNVIVFNEISTGTCNPAKIIGPGSALYEVNIKVLIIALGQI